MNVSFSHSHRPVIIEKSSSVTLSCVCVSLRSSTSLSAWLLFSFSLLFFCWSFSFLWVADIYVIIAYPHSTHIQLHGLQWWRSVAGQFPFSMCWIKNMSFSCSYKTRTFYVDQIPGVQRTKRRQNCITFNIHIAIANRQILILLHFAIERVEWRCLTRRPNMLALFYLPESNEAKSAVRCYRT